jgi:lysophospholipase L1-like esterase
LLTVPNDSYYRRKYPNPFTEDARQVIYQLASEYNMAVWDLYELMGGLGSSQYWYQHKLMSRDRVHFSKLGYSLKADLFLEALTASIEDVLGLEPRSLLNQIINE